MSKVPNIVLEKNFTNQTIDDISFQVVVFCKRLNMQRRDIIRYRLTAEEFLLRWKEHVSENAKITFRTGFRFFQPFFILEYKGPSNDPIQDNHGYSQISQQLLSSLGLTPDYSYVNGINRLLFTLTKPDKEHFIRFSLFLISSILLSLLGRGLLSEATRTAILTQFIQPVHHVLLNLLCCIACPMIFLSVISVVNSIGNTVTFEKNGRKMLWSYISSSLALTMLALLALLAFPFICPALASDGKSQPLAIFNMLLNSVPDNIVSPFAQGNILQIIFLAIIISYVLLFLGKKVSAIAMLVEQAKGLVQYIMSIIGKLVPYYIFIFMIQMLWSDNAVIGGIIWKLLLAFIACVLFITAILLLFTAAKQKTSPILLLRKGLPPFMTAFFTASSSAAFSTTLENCEKKYGVKKSLANFGIPLGIVIHTPITATYYMLLTFYFARQCNLECSASWLAMTVLASIILAIATPSVPGGSAAMYVIMFKEIGIPWEALVIPLAFDAAVDSLCTAFENLDMQLMLVNIASSLGLLDKNKLKEPMAPKKPAL